jgi:predicted SprT family Zn-dependent metalloprotease
MASTALTPSAKRAHLSKVTGLALALMKQHGLSDWTIEWGRAKNRAGVCIRDKKLIRLSASLMSLWTMDQCKDVILHEIAHALTPGHGHDAVWKCKCREIGADPTRTWGHNGEVNLNDTAKWVGECPNGHMHYRHRKPSVYKNQSCGQCSHRFNEKYLITWRKR